MIGSSYNERLKDRHRAGRRMSARALNRVADMINGMRGEGGIIVEQERGGIVVRATGLTTGQGTGPWKYTINQAARTITVADGDVIEPTRPPYTCTSVAVLVTGGTKEAPHRIVLEHVRGVGPTIVAVASSVKPVSEPGIFRCALYDVGVVNGRVRVFAQRRFGDIDVPGYV